MARKLVFMRAHFLEWYVLIEYNKLLRSMNKGDECIIFFDNTKNVIDCKDNHPIKMINFSGLDAKCLLYNDALHKESHLPLYTDDRNNQDSGNLLWFNGDYPFYYVRNYFPDFDYYWCTEYDVFCNGDSYKPFFKQYEKDDSDFLSVDYKPIETKPEERYNSEWAYTKEEHYCSFFPVIRLSGKAVDFLYASRLRQAEIFSKIKHDVNHRWIYCELFAPSELTKNGFKCNAIDMKTIRYEPKYNLNIERIFEYPDYKLYHPVK